MNSPQQQIIIDAALNCEYQKFGFALSRRNGNTHVLLRLKEIFEEQNRNVQFFDHRNCDYIDEDMDICLMDDETRIPEANRNAILNAPFNRIIVVRPSMLSQ